MTTKSQIQATKTIKEDLKATVIASVTVYGQCPLFNCVIKPQLPSMNLCDIRNPEQGKNFQNTLSKNRFKQEKSPIRKYFVHL